MFASKIIWYFAKSHGRYSIREHIISRNAKFRKQEIQKASRQTPKYFKKEPAALVFKNREFIKIDIDNLDIDPENTFIDAKLSIEKEYDQLNTEIAEIKS